MSATDKFDPDALKLLSQEEIDAINAEPSPEELIVMRQQKEAERIIAEKGDDPDDGGEGDDAGLNDDAGSDVDAAINGASAPDTLTDTTSASAENLQFDNNRPAYKVDLPEDFQAQMDDLKTQKAEIAQRFRDGEIDLDEFTDLNDGLQEKRDALNALKLKADIAEDMQTQAETQAWENSFKSFLAETLKHDGIDYLKDTAKRVDLDAFLKALANNPANNDKPHAWYLQEAHKRTLALHELPPSQKSPDRKNHEKPNRKPPVDAIPANLAHVAGSDGPGDTVGDEFVDIDKLDGIELKRAIAAMSPVQRQKYLAGA